MRVFTTQFALLGLLAQLAHLMIAAEPPTDRRPTPIRFGTGILADATGDGTEQSIVINSQIAPIIRPAPEGTGDRNREGDERGVAWGSLFRQSLFFVGVQHGFRLATEPGTREARGPFWKGYTSSIGSLHGWSDGDPFYVNYIGHPMQGAVSGFIWVQNDRSYRTAEFGASSRYWKSRLRAGIFAFAYSEQFEIGPVSEASIGYIQSQWPQQGFVDHVVTPVIGTGWLIAEDALDRFVIKPLELKTDNPYLKMMLRSWLNPSRSFANVMRWKVPWVRDTRPGLFGRNRHRSNFATQPQKEPEDLQPYPEVAPIEATAAGSVRSLGNGSTCTGGGGDFAFRLAPKMQLVANIGGCKVNGLPENVTGDSLMYLIGPRWTPSPAGRWSPYAHVLIGGNRITVTEEFPALKQIALKTSETGQLDASNRDQYAVKQDSNNLALSAGTGIDFKVNRAMAVRVASVEYTKSWANRMHGVDFGNGGMQFSAGMILRIGTW